MCSQCFQIRIAVYLDINLFKQIGEREPKKVPNTKGLVTITFKVPSNLVNTDSSVTRKYQVVRVHEGEVTIIDVVYDETTGMISFETDKFSTYAIVYKDQPIENDAGESGTNDKNDTSKDDVPKAGVISTTSIWLGTMALSGLGVLLVSKKKKED
jgi:LPXTG-motif cell wall-anchored protein